MRLNLRDTVTREATCEMPSQRCPMARYGCHISLKMLRVGRTSSWAPSHHNPVASECSNSSRRRYERYILHYCALLALLMGCGNSSAPEDGGVDLSKSTGQTDA